MFSEKEFNKGKALVLAPHPDDEVFGCGGAIIRYLEQGDEVKVVIATDGGLPVNESQKVPEYSNIRKQESLEAAKILGYGQPEFLEFKDGSLKADEKLIARLMEIIRQFQPQNIYLPADTEIHPDHLALSKAGIEAATRFSENVNLFFYEIGQPLRPNFFLDVTELQPRLDQAMGCFASQLAVQDYKTEIRALHAYRSYTLGRDVNFAEAYRTIKSNELKTEEILWPEKQLDAVEKLPATKTAEEFPLISVIVRTMNRPQLPEALESIAAQTYPNLEVIVVDALGEKPLDLGNRCGRFPMRIISKSQPLNRPAAANAGLDEVKGNYFCFLDEDDILMSEAIDKLVIILDKSHAPAVYCTVERVNDMMEHEMRYNFPFSYGKLFWENYIPNLAVLYRSELREIGCRFDESLEVMEDWDFLLQVCEKGDLVFGDTLVGVYRNFNFSGVQLETEKTTHFRRKVIEKWIQRIPMHRWTEVMNNIRKGQLQEGPVFYAQFFYKGNEDAFREENSRRMAANFTNGVYDFVFPEALKATSFRFDPLNQPVILKLGTFTLMYKEAVLDISWKIHTNACCHSDEGELFETGDPQVYLEPLIDQELLVDQVKIELEYLCSGIEAMEKVAAHKQSQIAELLTSQEMLNMAVAEKEKTLNHQKTLIVEQEFAIANISGELSQSRQELEHVNQALSQIREELQQADKSLQAQKQTSADLEYRRIELEHTLKLTGRQLAELERLGNLYRAEIAENQERLKNYQDHLAELLHSREYQWSVRISKTLRFLNPRSVFSNFREYQSSKELARLIKESSLFDAQFYLVNNPDVASARITAEWHFLKFGGAEGRDPSPGFNTSFYLRQYHDVKESGMNPLVHFLIHGQQEGRNPLPPVELTDGSDTADIKTGNTSLLIATSPFTKFYDQWVQNAGRKPGKDYEPEFDCEGSRPGSVKTIAFYLPQFHPIPENDQWWGKGFTEWTNVTKAVPQFEGHYQPRLPDGLGFYDLRLPEVIRQQVALAQKYGVHGFCFHYYWFEGRRLLEKPLQLFIENGIEFPFCICWANENWTRRWDGSEDDILISQPHNFANDKNFIADVIPLLKDPRYIRINGRPLIIVYRPGLLEESSATLNFWREECARHGVENPYLVGAQTFGLQDPTPLGFDAAIEFPPLNGFYNRINSQCEIMNKTFQGSIYDYREMVERSFEKPCVEYRLFRTVAPSWDNEARKPGNGHSFINSSPERYNYWLEALCRHEMKSAGGEPMVFINAWNEWAEGAYLEPDRRYGYAYLNATYKALKAVDSLFLVDHSGKRVSEVKKKARLAVIIHVYYWEMFTEIACTVKQLPEPADVYISLPQILAGRLPEVFAEFSGAQIMVVENRGRDVAPFIMIFREISELGYDRILKVHTKKSPHRADGEHWRDDILSKLVRSSKSVKAVAEAFQKSPDLGIVGPLGHVLHKSYYWGSNQELTLKLAVMVGISANEKEGFHFVAGSMFWFRPEALKPILKLPVSFYDFPEEPIPPDGTLAHAIERLFGLFAISGDYKVMQIDTEGTLSFAPESNGFAFAEPIQEI
jgi:lipopolysaccharide biosynthesis protein/LmbE family N-acetylglucosaminyl deacetylase/glycosyltransferase involved in cell wall biosynthesis